MLELLREQDPPFFCRKGALRKWILSATQRIARGRDVDFRYTNLSGLFHTPELPCVHVYLCFGSGGSDIRLKTYTRFFAFGLRPRHARSPSFWLDTNKNKASRHSRLSLSRHRVISYSLKNIYTFIGIRLAA